MIARSRNGVARPGRAAVATNGGPVWLVHRPPSVDAGDGVLWDPAPAWLEEIRSFRAEVLYADGKRPRFRDADGRFRDDDPVDGFAHHLVACCDGAVIASLRIVPIVETGIGFCERVFGSTAVDELLSNLGTSRATTCEGSGWAVAPTRRGAAMGSKVLAAGTGVARELGFSTMIGAAGRRFGQLYRAMSVGYRTAPGVPPVEVASLADEVHLVHLGPDQWRPAFREHVERLTPRLVWSNAAHPLG